MIHFDESQWASIRETYGRYWDKTIDRPVIGLMVKEHAPSGKEPKHPLLSQANCNDLSVSPECIIDAIEYNMSQYGFYGDAYPLFKMDVFGPGVVAAFLGALLDNSTGSVWFHPKERLELDDINLTYDPDNIWLGRIKDICKLAKERLQGKILLSITDLGGVLDIAATFRQSENLLLDLYDDAEGVKRISSQIDTLWMQYYDELSEALGQDRYGYTDWSTLYSQTPSYIMQCDFAYMISPAMFGEFVVPSLERHAKTLSHTIYHLDGVGQLNHLDDLLSIRDLDAVQWIMGDGHPPASGWPQVYEKILRAGKQVSLAWSSFEEIGKVLSQAPTTAGFHHPFITVGASDKQEALGYLKRFGVI
jgi:5-methyltetrahydrofolate--homocysteine methyltransferase